VRRLIVNLYEDPKRGDEMLETLVKNAGVFDQLLIFTSGKVACERLMYSTNLTNFEVVSEDRPTFRDYFVWANSVSGAWDLNVVANVDIEVSKEALVEIDNRTHEGACLALSRWDTRRGLDGEPVEVIHGGTDLWSFRGLIRIPERSVFPLGLFPCDYAINHSLLGKGYVMTNPAKSIKLYHRHTPHIYDFDDGFISRPDITE